MIYRSYVCCNTIKVNRPTNKLILKTKEKIQQFLLFYPSPVSSRLIIGTL